MAYRLTLHGIVQGVFCRAYCSQYAKKHRLRGSASNMPDGTVRVILDTDDEVLMRRYVQDLRSNPDRFTFYGRIDEVEVDPHHGPICGDYVF